MHHVVDLIVRECGVMHRFLPDSAISQAVRIALDQVKHKRPFAEPYILVADFGGPLAPSLPASKKAAYQPAIKPWINTLHHLIMTSHTHRLTTPQNPLCPGTP